MHITLLIIGITENGGKVGFLVYKTSFKFLFFWFAGRPTHDMPVQRTSFEDSHIQEERRPGYGGISF